MSKKIRSISPLAPETNTESPGLKTLNVDGRTITYQDVGSGPTIILAHCSSASHREWETLVAELSGRFRVLAPDLVGYGKSEPWPLQAPIVLWSDLHAILALADIAGEPVHLGGHSYGGAVALEAARVLGWSVKSLTLVEPAAFHLLRLTGRTREWKELTTAGNRVVANVRASRMGEAAAEYMNYWVGRLRWWLTPLRARQRVVATISKVAAEFEYVKRISTPVALYRRISAPTRLIAGERTLKPSRAIVDELLGILPHAHLRVIPRAAHMSPITHPGAVFEQMGEHIEACERVAGRWNQGTVLQRLGPITRRAIGERTAS